ncbi:MAG: hypothetical protein E7214_07465 [Clostridium sp.]|nr:hypothetical protein [Clostridium sp.]
MKKLKVIIMSGILGVAIASPIISNATIRDYGSEANIGGVYKYVYAYTQTDGGPARARAVIGGEQSDKTLNGWAQTNQIFGWYTRTAYIGHGEGGDCTICYTK